MNEIVPPSNFHANGTSGLNTRQNALALAKRGLRVFRIKKGSQKHFIDADWATSATADPREVWERFTDQDTWAPLDCNIGVVADGLVYIDVDAAGDKHKHDGRAAWDALGVTEPTFTVDTPSGGRHYYYSGEGKIYSQRDLAPGINVRCGNGYVVGPGSTHPNGGVYTIANDAPIAPLPAAVAARLSAAKERSEAAAVCELDQLQNIEAARQWLATHKPAIEGQGGDRHTFETCCRVLDFGLSAEAALDALRAWNDRCDPPWDDVDLEKKIDNALTYRKSPVGSLRPDDAHEDLSAAVADIRSPKRLKFLSEISRAAVLASQSNAIVKGLIGPGELGMLYGDPAAGKTFVGLYVAFQIARGAELFGMKTRRVPVLYISFEGHFAFDKRLVAAREAYGDPEQYFAQLAITVTLGQSEGGEAGARQIIAAYRDLMSAAGVSCPGIIFVDTLSRARAGDDEDNAAEVSELVERRLGLIQRETGATLCLVHHTNKNGGMRGSSVLEGACDFILRVDREDGQSSTTRRLVAQKVKDGEECELMSFTLKREFLGLDADDEAVTTCTVTPLTIARRALASEVVKIVDKVLREALQAGITLHTQKSGRTSPAGYVIEKISAGEVVCECTPDEIFEAVKTLMNAGRYAEEQYHPAKTSADKVAYRLAFGSAADSSADSTIADSPDRLATKTEKLSAPANTGVFKRRQPKSADSKRRSVGGRKH